MFLLGFVFSLKAMLNSAAGMILTVLNIRALAIGTAESIHQSWKATVLFLPVITNLLNTCWKMATPQMS